MIYGGNLDVLNDVARQKYHRIFFYEIGFYKKMSEIEIAMGYSRSAINTFVGFFCQKIANVLLLVVGFRGQ